MTRPRRRIILLKRDGVLPFLSLAPEEVSNKAFAAEDSGLLRSSWPVARTRVRVGAETRDEKSGTRKSGTRKYKKTRDGS